MDIGYKLFSSTKKRRISSRLSWQSTFIKGFIIWQKIFFLLCNKMGNSHRAIEAHIAHSRSSQSEQRIRFILPEAPGGSSWEFLVGVCCPLLQILTLLQTKKCHFPNPFSNQTSKIHTCTQSWPSGRNYVIITLIECKQKKILQIHLDLTYFSFFLTHLE